MYKRKSGARKKPTQWTPKEQVIRRLQQASRAHDSKRNVEKNADRIRRLETELTMLEAK